MRTLTLRLALLYTLLFVLWRGLLLTPLYNAFWQLQLSEVFSPWFYLPLLGPLSLLLFTRQRIGLWVLLIPLVCFAVEYGRQFLPNWQETWYRDATAPRVRVLTWNTQYTTDDDDAFLRTVTAVQPDLIALQEVSYFLRSKLARELISRYPYQVANTLSNSEFLVILSRYPLLAQDFDDRRRGCRCQHVTLDLHGQPISLINTHIPSPQVSFNVRQQVPRVYRFEAQFQNNTVDGLLARMTQQSNPLLLVGDLNLTDRQRPLRRLQAQLDDAFAAAGWGMGFTFPYRKTWPMLPIPPLVRIDHILYSAEWRALWAQRGTPLDSDHLYVVADLLLVP